jgi:vesicular inhibitory amino acid transporter
VGTGSDDGFSVSQSSWQQTTLVVMGQVMGTGVLALPHACTQLGWVVGLSAIAIFACAGTYAGILLARSRVLQAEAPTSYADLARLTGGPSFGTFTRVAICGSWTLILPYYLLSCAQAGQLAFTPLLGEHAGSLCTWHWTAATAVALLPALQLRTLHQLSTLAFVSTVSVVVAIAIVLSSLLLQPLALPPGPATDTELAPPGLHSGRTSLWPPALSSPMQLYAHTGEIIYAFQGHSIFLELVREMRSPAQFGRALYVSNALMAGAYMLTSAIGYAARGGDVAGFLPDSMAEGGARAVVGGLLAFHTAVGYLITALPLQREVSLLLRRRPARHATPSSSTDGATFTFGGGSTGPAGPPGALSWLLISLGLVTFSFVVANGIPFFAIFQSLLGSLTGAPILFGWPAFFYLRSCRMRGWPVAWGDILGCGAFLAICTPLFTVLGTVNAIADVRAAWQASDAHAPFMCAT